VSDLVRLLDPVRLNCLGGFFCLVCLRGGPNFNFLFWSFNPKSLFPLLERGGGGGGESLVFPVSGLRLREEREGVREGVREYIYIYIYIDIDIYIY
jgi:hypothetical protein